MAELDNDIEMSDVNEVSVTSAISENVQFPAAPKHIGRKNMKKIEAVDEKKTATKEISENITKQKADAAATSVDGKKKKSNENKSNSAGNEAKKAAGNEAKKAAGNEAKKAAVHPQISEMVMDSFSNLRKRGGTSAEDVSKYVEENYQVNINRIKPFIKRFLQKGVASGLFEQVSGHGEDAKFKVTKAEKNGKRVKMSKGNDNKRVGKVTEKVKKEVGKIRKAAVKAKKDVNAKGRRLSTRKSTK